MFTTILAIIGALAVLRFILAFILLANQSSAVSNPTPSNVRPKQDYWADGWEKTF